MQSDDDLETFDYEPLVLDHSVGYKFGLTFGIRPVSSDKEEQPLIRVQKAVNSQNTFHGLFDQKDTDFEIFAKNHSSHEIGFRVILNNDISKRKNFIMEPWSDWSLKALEDRGNHLHFMSQETDEGKMLVAMHAKRQKVSYAEAAVTCSCIEIQVEIAKTWQEREYEKKKEEEERKRAEKEKFQRILEDKNFTVVVKSSDGEYLLIETEPDCMIKNFKELVGQKQKIPSDLQILLYDEKDLDDKKSLSDYNIKHAGILHLKRDLAKEAELKEKILLEEILKDDSRFIVLIRSHCHGLIPIITAPHHTIERIKAALQRKTGILASSQILVPEIGGWRLHGRLSDNDIQHGDILELHREQYGGGCPTVKTINSEDDENSSTSEEESDSENSKNAVGARGVICFGAKTDQRFSTYRGNFVASKALSAHSFVLELRMNRLHDSTRDN